MNNNNNQTISHSVLTNSISTSLTNNIRDNTEYSLSTSTNEQQKINELQRRIEELEDCVKALSLAIRLRKD